MTDDQPTPQPSPFELHKWHEELKRREAERAHDKEFDFSQKVNESVITGANIALRTALLINGGAAGVLLAFVGNLYAKNPEAIGKKIGDLVSPLMWFAWGVVFASSAISLAYFVNYTIVAQSAKKDRVWSHPYVVESKKSKRWKWASIALHILTVLVGVGSLVFFIIGMLAIRNSLVTIAQ